MFKNFKPMNDRVLAVRMELEDTTEGGIIIPESAKLSNTHTYAAKVIAVGKGKKQDDGYHRVMQVKKGDMVYVSRHSGIDVGNEHIVLNENEILAVIDK